jgi:hypothetical protein
VRAGRGRKKDRLIYTTPVTLQEMHICILYFFGREKIGSDIRAFSVLYGIWLLPFPGETLRGWFRDEGLSEPRGGRKDEDEGREYNFIFFSKLPFIETQRDFLSPLRLKHEVIVRFVEIKLSKEGIFKILHSQKLRFSLKIGKVFWMHFCHLNAWCELLKYRH